MNYKILNVLSDGSTKFSFKFISNCNQIIFNEKDHKTLSFNKKNLKKVNSEFSTKYKKLYFK